MTNIHFRDTSSRQDKDVAVTVDGDLGFTIDAKIMVSGSPQYKVHNSRGKTYFINASSIYVVVN
nr:N-acetylmuramoyl-L-alanine amidase [Bacillus cereus group sp. BfR-BA-01383]